MAGYEMSTECSKHLILVSHILLAKSGKELWEVYKVKSRNIL